MSESIDPIESSSSPGPPFSLQTKRAVAIGVVLGWAAYNLYLAPGHGALGGSLVRPTALMAALLLVTWGFQFHHVVAGTTAAVVMLSGIAVVESLWVLFGAGAAGWTVGVVLERSVVRGKAGGGWVCLLWAMLLTGLWIAAIRFGVQRDEAGQVNRELMLLSLQGILVPAIGWAAAVLWRRNARFWSVIVLGLSLTVGVTYALSWRQTATRDVPTEPAVTQPIVDQAGA